MIYLAILTAIALIGGPVVAFLSRKMVARIRKAAQSEVHSTSGIIQVGRELSQGSQVSGGQRQRVALSRAYLKNAPIILLDEPTSALDSETEEVIQRELRLLTKGKIILVIAHRLSTILRPDLIHVIEGGRVVERGHMSNCWLRVGPTAGNSSFNLQNLFSPRCLWHVPSKQGFISSRHRLSGFEQ